MTCHHYLDQIITHDIIEMLTSSMTSYLDNIITCDIIEIGEDDVMLLRCRDRYPAPEQKRSEIFPERSTDIVHDSQRRPIAAFPGLQPNPPPKLQLRARNSQTGTASPEIPPGFGET